MWGFVAAIQTVLALKRTCQKCGNSQIVERSKLRKSVACNRCGNILPAPRLQK